MATTRDGMYDTLTGLGYSGTIRDMLFEFWGDEGGTGNTTIERFRSAMVLAGVPDGNTTDMWFQYLEDLLIPGALGDKEHRFWTGLINNYWDGNSTWNGGAFWID